MMVQTAVQRSRPRGRGPSPTAVAAALRASRALVAIAARSMAGIGDITLVQYRALVVIAQRGPQRAGDLADALGIQPSTLTRLADRLEQKGLIGRHASPTSRRAIEIDLSPAGRRLLAQVARRRTKELTKVLSAVRPEQQQAILEGLEAFAEAAGELAEHEWAIPWS